LRKSIVVDVNESCIIIDMTYCAQLLKNYYEKEHNKIVFCNGMTLSQLAIEMWEKMGHEQIIDKNQRTS